ncbi:TolC family protein, partial [Alistipes onderdonkii]
MNMKIAVRTLLAAAALATIVRLSAQEAKRTLSLDEAIAVALTENPAMKAAEFEEKAATQERRAAIGLRMPKISVMGAYAYMSKDIGFDFNEMKGPAKELAGQILGSGLIPPEMIPSINGLLNPLMNADWFLKVQDQSLGFV